MRVSGLDHIFLNVANVERSLDFYQGCLGLSAEGVEESLAGKQSVPRLRIDEATLIELVQVDDYATGAQPGLRSNLARVCLVTDDSEVTGIAADLNGYNASIEAGPVTRTGARGDCTSIYFRDPDSNLIEVRTYACRPLIRAAIDEARLRVRSAIAAMDDPNAPVIGNEAWSKKDLISHLTSIEGWWRQQIEIFIYARPWDMGSLHEFNDRAVAERRDWSLEQLTEELEHEAAALQALLETLDESDLTRLVEHPARASRRLADGWRMLCSHAERHLAELRQPN